MSIQTTITATLEDAFKPQELLVINQSQQHQWGEADSHFKILVVCDRFATLSRLSRHRAIYQRLTTLLKPLGPIHALALHAYSPQERLSDQFQLANSPPCSNKIGRC
ncbi:MAG: BolA family protein [Candidatus Symbiodolus clandestinus]